MPIYEERCEALARYIIKNAATLRQAAANSGISKSTVHKDVTEKLKDINPGLFTDVKCVLEKNRSERHIRGGEATKNKYAVLRNNKEKNKRKTQRK